MRSFRPVNRDLLRQIHDALLPEDRNSESIEVVDGTGRIVLTYTENPDGSVMIQSAKVH